jgi:hypothetical protein
MLILLQPLPILLQDIPAERFEDAQIMLGTPCVYVVFEIRIMFVKVI